MPFQFEPTLQGSDDAVAMSKREQMSGGPARTGTTAATANPAQRAQVATLRNVRCVMTASRQRNRVAVKETPPPAAMLTKGRKGRKVEGSKGHRVTGSEVARFQGCRVAELQGYRISMSQDEGQTLRLDHSLTKCKIMPCPASRA